MYDTIMRMKHNRHILASSLISLAGLILMMNFTSPTEIGPVGVLLFFGMIYVVFFGMISLIMSYFYRLALGKKEFRRKDYLYFATAAFGPIMLLTTNSFGILSIWTAAAIIVCLILIEFLIYKRV